LDQVNILEKDATTLVHEIDEMQERNVLMDNEINNERKK